MRTPPLKKGQQVIGNHNGTKTVVLIRRRKGSCDEIIRMLVLIMAAQLEGSFLKEQIPTQEEIN